VLDGAINLICTKLSGGLVTQFNSQASISELTSESRHKMTTTEETPTLFTVWNTPVKVKPAMLGNLVVA
jgi:hypothetical protein